MQILVVITIIVYLATFIMGIRVSKKKENKLDIKIRDYIQKVKDPQLYDFLAQLTRLANVEVVFVLVLVLSFILISDGNYKAASSLFIAAFLSGLSSHGLKLIFRRTRPVKRKKFNYTGYSFPSGHAAVGTCFYTVLAYLLCQLFGFSSILIAIAIVLGMVIALTRVYLSAHWMVDVIFGFLLGLVCAGWTIYLYEQNVNIISYFID